MVQLLLLFFGTYAMLRGKFSIGNGKPLYGRPARWLGALCMVNIPFAFAFTAIWVKLGHLGIANVPTEGQLRLLEVGLVALNVVGVAMVAGKLYHLQHQAALEQASPE